MLNSFRMFDSQDDWDLEVKNTADGLERNTGKSDLAAFGAQLIADRIKQYPYSYTEFGVYWFAVKDLLNRHGYDFGDNTDEEMLAEYRGKTDAHTLVAAERFKTFYRQNYFQGTVKFTLEDDDMREWVLSDSDMTA